MEACASATNSSNQLYELCRHLKRILNADYVDVCEVVSHNEFQRLAKDWNPALFDGFSPVWDPFKCKFRAQACLSERGSRLVSNTTDVQPVTPGSTSDTAAIFQTSVGKSTGSTFSIKKSDRSALKRAGIPSSVLHRLFDGRNKAVGTTYRSHYDALKAYKSALHYRDSTENIDEILESIMRQASSRVEGVISVSFEKRRILTFMELSLIDKCAQLAQAFVTGTKDDSDLKGLLIRAIKATAQVSASDLPDQMVEVISDYMEVKYCSLSRVDAMVIKCIAYKGYLEGYDFNHYSIGEGRTGLIIRENKVVRQDFATVETMDTVPSTSVQFYDARHGYQEVPSAVADQLRDGSKCSAYVDDSDDIATFLGIPMEYTSDDGHKSVVGCIKLVRTRRDPDLTDQKIRACLEVAPFLALVLMLSNERDARQIALAEATAQRLTLDERSRQLKAMSHDWNTPIGTMSVAAAVIEKLIDEAPLLNPNYSRLKSKILTVQEELRHLETLTEFGKSIRDLELKPKVLPTTEWISDYWEKAKETNPGKRIVLTASKKLGAIKFDPGHLSRILDNLIRNSLEANASFVEMRARNFKEHVRIDIIDDGDGVKAEHRENIWTAYFTTKSVNSNSGYGLAAVRELANANHATAEGPLLKGNLTVFRIIAPVYDDGN